MKIAFYSPSWPASSSANGIVTYVSQIAPALRELGHEVLILTPHVMGRHEGREVINLQDFQNRPSLRKRLAARSGIGNFERYTQPLVSAIKHLVSEARIDILEMEESFGWNYAISKLKLLPVVVRIHGPWFLTKRWDDTKREKLEGRGLRSASVVTSPTQIVLDQTIDRYGLKNKSLPIRNPIARADATWDASACDQSSLLFVGRFDAIKGGDLVLRAFEKLASGNAALTLHLRRSR